MIKEWQRIHDIEVPCRCINYKKINGFYVPCGKCQHCLKRMADDWAFRIESEVEDKYVYNVLLTYDEEHIYFAPNDKIRPSLNKVHVQLFMKRFRYYLDEIFGSNVRYFCVGEYGGFNHRPHYHMMLFSETNLSDNGNMDLVHELLNTAWQKGMTNIEPLTNPKGQCFYMTAYLLSVDDGVFYKQRQKPFKLMSRNPAIGRNWIDKHPRTVEKCVREMDYTYRVVGRDKTYTKSLPRYIKRKIMPEEQRKEFADAWREQSFEFDMYLKTLKKTDYAERRKRVQEKLKELQREQYEREKCHKRCRGFSQSNRNASQVFAPTQKTTCSNF